MKGNVFNKLYFLSFVLCCFYLTFEGAFQYVLGTEYTDKVLMGNYVRFLLSYGMIRVIILGDHNGNKSPDICTKQCGVILRVKSPTKHRPIRNHK